MDYQDAIKHLKENYPDEYSEDGFEDGAIELLLNHFYHGLRSLVEDTDELSDKLHDLIGEIAPKLDWFVMSYCAEAYMQAKMEIEE